MLNKFYKEQKVLIEVSAFFVAVCGVFLNISSPENAEARKALANVQFFLLTLLLICVGALFINLIKFIRNKEKVLEEKYDLVSGVFSLSLVGVLFWLFQSLFNYVYLLYSTSLVAFLSSMYPMIIGTLGGLIFLYVETHKEKFMLFSEILIISFVISFELVSFAMYAQELFLKYFYTAIFWLGFPSLFLFIFTSIIVIATHAKRDLTVPLIPKKR